LAHGESDSKVEGGITTWADAAKADKYKRYSSNPHSQKQKEDIRANTNSMWRNNDQPLAQSRRWQKNGEEAPTMAKPADDNQTKQLQLLTPATTCENAGHPSQENAANPSRRLNKNKADAPFTPMAPTLSLRTHAAPVSNDRSMIHARK